MRIAIPTEGRKGLEERIAYHFGRSKTYTIIDEDKNTVEIIDNTSEHMGGSGLPPELLEKKGVKIVLCRAIGPKAVNLLQEKGIKVYTTNAETVKQALNEMKSKARNLQ